MKKLIIGFILLVGFNQQIRSQDKFIDSIKHVLNKTTTDSIRLKCHYELAFTYYEMSNSKLMGYHAHNALMLADKINLTKFNGNLYSLLSYAERDKSNFALSYNYLKKAIDFFSKRKLQDKTAVAYGQMASLMANWSQLDESNKYLKLSLHYFLTIPNKTFIDSLHYFQASQLLASNLLSLKQYKNSRKIFTDCAQFYRKSNRIYDYARILTSISTIYSESGQLDSAYKNYTIALNLMKNVGDSSDMAFILSNIGNNYYNYGERSNVKSYYLKSDRTCQPGIKNVCQ